MTNDKIILRLDINLSSIQKVASVAVCGSVTGAAASSTGNCGNGFNGNRFYFSFWFNCNNFLGNSNFGNRFDYSYWFSCNNFFGNSNFFNLHWNWNGHFSGGFGGGRSGIVWLRVARVRGLWVSWVGWLRVRFRISWS